MRNVNISQRRGVAEKTRRCGKNSNISHDSYDVKSYSR